MFFAVKMESEEASKVPGMADLAEERKSMQMQAAVVPQASVRWSCKLGNMYAPTAAAVAEHQKTAASENLAISARLGVSVECSTVFTSR